MSQIFKFLKNKKIPSLKFNCKLFMLSKTYHFQIIRLTIRPNILKLQNIIINF